jgi:hypothetical protein
MMAVRAAQESKRLRPLRRINLLLINGPMRWDSKRGTPCRRAPFELKVVGQVESKHSISVAKNMGRRCLYKNHVAVGWLRL